MNPSNLCFFLPSTEKLRLLTELFSQVQSRAAITAVDNSPTTARDEQLQSWIQRRACVLRLDVEVTVDDSQGSFAEAAMEDQRWMKPRRGLGHCY